MASYIEGASTDAKDAKTESPRPSLTRLDIWEQVAKAIIREGLDPEGLSVPECDVQEWIQALAALYAMKEDE